MSGSGLGRPASRNRLVAGVIVAALVVTGWFLWPSGGSDGSGDQAAGPTSSTPSASPPTSSTPATSRPTPTRSVGVDPESGLRWVDLGSLPAEAAETVDLIEAGGPFPYDRDGITFGNREGLLPRERSGWYREYTVSTPGSDDRGARRIVTGDGDRDFFYSGDHYASFRRIRVGG